ncbi:hypothetical protein [Glaciecola sp. SC05]
MTLIQVKIDKLRGESVDIESMSKRFKNQLFPHAWMPQKDWASNDR